MNRGKFIAKKEEVAWKKKCITVYSKYKKRKSIALLINKRNLILTVVA